jgi:hypothetical protein
LFDLSLELDVRIETKIMFAFHPDIVFSPFAWPRAVLDRHIDELLGYMEPKATRRQETLVKTLQAMKGRPTFAEQWPDTHDQQFKNGRHYQQQLDVIRKDAVNIETIYSRDPELLAWWKREIP